MLGSIWRPYEEVFGIRKSFPNTWRWVLHSWDFSITLEYRTHPTDLGLRLGLGLGLVRIKVPQGIKTLVGTMRDYGTHLKHALIYLKAIWRSIWNKKKLSQYMKVSSVAAISVFQFQCTLLCRQLYDLSVHSNCMRRKSNIFKHLSTQMSKLGSTKPLI